MSQSHAENDSHSLDDFLSGRRQAERHQASNLALCGFESCRPLHRGEKTKGILKCVVEDGLPLPVELHKEIKF
jgi:hypothetical protein